MATSETPALARHLGPWTLWGLGVGYVISGMYFGWNLGLPVGGPYGMAVATVLVTVLYVTFVLSYAELACALPQAGGAFVYARRALGPGFGVLAGMAQAVEFVFAPPAIALAIGAYVNLLVPVLSPGFVGLLAYVSFTALNVWGVRASALFELGITAIAVGELLLFAGLTLPHFSWAAFSTDPLPGGWQGVIPALPFAIWFYLAIEGVANVAEEAEDPQRDLARGFGSAMATLVVLAALTFLGAVGVAGWSAVVYPKPGAEPSDSPLPLALSHVVGPDHPMYHLLVLIGLFGLVASFHGIILCAGRALFELGRAGLVPRILGKVHATRSTPAPALTLNLVMGTAALWTGQTGKIITISVFGALTLYLVSLVSFFALRRNEPDLVRPYRTPLVPVVPAVSLALTVLCLGALAWSEPQLFGIFVGIVAVASAGAALFGRTA